ncbi:hypothetical protein EDB89DRAFT_1912859 [Lactarius sanguifluus]|nr:hypothetical protein EDB89DRAFT_1912859 [Lactarius sanguifluus]
MGWRWWGVGVAWRGVGVAGLVCQRAVTGQWGLACRIGAMWWVGGGRVLAWRGVAGRRALRAMLGWRGGLAGCWGRDEWRWNGLQRPGSCVPCWGGAAGWRWWHVGAGSGLCAPGGGNDLQRSGAYVLITSEDGRGAWKGESGEAGRGVEVGAQAGGLRSEIWHTSRHIAIAAPLCMRATSIRPHPNTPLRHGSQHATTANPPGRPNTAHKTFGPINKISHCHSLVHTSHLHFIPAPTRSHRQPTAPPQHGTQDLWPNAIPPPFVPAPTPRQPTVPPQHGTQDLDRQPTTMPPQHGMQRPTTRNAPSMRHATPQQPPTPMPPQHGTRYPATRRLTTTPTLCHRRPATLPQCGAQDPANWSQHADVQDPANPPHPLQRDTQGPSNPTLTPPQHGTQDPANSPPRHTNTPPLPTHHVALTRRARPCQPATLLQHGNPCHVTTLAPPGPVATSAWLPL